MRGNEKQWQGEARWGRTKQGHGTVTPGNEHTIESKRRDNLRKDILVQYCDLQQEAKDIRKRIEKTQARLNRIQKGGTVLDSVSGTRADGTIGSIRIEGFPFGDFNKQWEHLNRYAESLSAAEIKLLEQAAEADLSARFWRKDWQSLQTFWNKCDGTAMGCRAGQWQSIDWRRGAKAEHGSRV